MDESYNLTKTQLSFIIKKFLRWEYVKYSYEDYAVAIKLLKYGFCIANQYVKDFWEEKGVSKFITHEDIEEGQDVIKLHLDRQGFFGSQLFYDKAIEEYDNMAKNVEHLEKELKEKKRKLEELKELIEV